MASPLPNIGPTNDQILSDIAELQTSEQQLFNHLETVPTLTPKQQESIVQRMNQLADMRINLYRSLNVANDYYQTTVSTSEATLKEQMMALLVIEKELNESKRQLAALKQKQINQMRMVEINEYYGAKYAEHSDALQLIFFMVIPVLILTALHARGTLPTAVYLGIVFIYLLLGGWLFWRRMASLWMRDNMNYQAYDWPFNAAKAASTSSADTQSAAGATDPWTSCSSAATCVGAACCSSDQTFDASANVCVDVSSPMPTPTPTPTVSQTTPNATAPTATTETFINRAIERAEASGNFYKPVYVQYGEYSRE